MEKNRNGTWYYSWFKSRRKDTSGEKVTVTADEDYYLALGDNTNGSYDSRMWGFVKESRIKEKLL